MYTNNQIHPVLRSTRRHFFRDCGVGVGKIALASLLTDSLRGRSASAAELATRDKRNRDAIFNPDGDAVWERHTIKNIGWLRAAVLGANDGIVSTASLVIGVAAVKFIISSW